MNQAPVITSATPTAAVQGQLFTYQAQASDPDAGDVLTWQLITAPAGMTISPTGLVTWTPSASQVGSNSVIIRVRDAAGLTAEQSFTINVTNVNDAPVISDPAPQQATEDVPFSLQLTATDPDGNQVFWFVVQGAEGLTVNMNTGLLSWTPRQNVAGTTVVARIRATDAVLSDTTTVSITVIAVNDPPVITCVLPDQFKTDTLYSLLLTATDEEGDPITWTVPRKPATMTIISNTLVWAPTTPGIDTLMVIASDGHGADTLIQVVQVLSTATHTKRAYGGHPAALSISSWGLRTGRLSLTVGVPSESRFATVSLYGVSGQKLCTRAVDGAGWHTVTLDNISRGTYLVKLETETRLLSKTITVH